MEDYHRLGFLNEGEIVAWKHDIFQWSAGPRREIRHSSGSVGAEGAVLETDHRSVCIWASRASRRWFHKANIRYSKACLFS